MTDFNFLNVIERFGFDTLLVSLIVVFIVWLLKKTVLKNHLDLPVIPFLPFIFGVICFLLLQCVLHPSADFLLNNLRFIVESGFTAGCLATWCNAVLARLFAKKRLPDKAALVRELLSFPATEEELNALAVRVANCVSQEYSDEDVLRVFGELIAFEGENASESGAAVLAELIVKTLKTAAA